MAVKLEKRDCCTREAAEHSGPDQKIDGDICVWQPEGPSASHTHSQYFVFKIFFFLRKKRRKEIVFKVS